LVCISSSSSYLDRNLLQYLFYGLLISACLPGNLLRHLGYFLIYGLPYSNLNCDLNYYLLYYCRRTSGSSRSLLCYLGDCLVYRRLVARSLLLGYLSY
jgi:hypothetical protein